MVDYGSQEEWEAFFHRIFAEIIQRRTILFRWQKLRQKTEATRVATAFESFLYMIMYQPISIRFMSDRMLIFGEHYPLRFQWLNNKVDKDFVASVFENRTKVFKSHRHYGNDQFDYFELHFDEASLLPTHMRRQFARDFVWLIADTCNSALILEMIAAIQWIILRKPTELFLAQLNQGLQGSCELSEVPCWDATPWDLHPLVKEKKKRKIEQQTK